ncbi:MAG: DUF2892 domain-containing protein [Campylobacterales bacterium]
MKCNVGKKDKFIRAILGSALMAYGVTVGVWLFFLIGLIPMATAITNYCPLYALLGISTIENDTDLP